MKHDEVFVNIIGDIDQTVKDIQEMLTHCCIWDCGKCRFDHLCVRERDYEPTREEFDELE